MPPNNLAYWHEGILKASRESVRRSRKILADSEGMVSPPYASPDQEAADQAKIALPGNPDTPSNRPKE